MQVWQVKIETVGTFLFDKYPTGKTLCDALFKKVNIELLKSIRKGLYEKGWEHRKLPNLVSMNLRDYDGYLSIYCIQLDVLEIQNNEDNKNG